MHATDRAQFATLFGQVMSYYRQDVSDFTRDLFWNAFEGHEFDAVRRAFEKHAKDPEQGRFAPKVADLVKILAGTASDRAALAWGKTHDAMGRVGAYTDVVFDDPVIHAVVLDMGGWPKLCRTDLNDLGYTQKRFMDTYKAYSNRGEFDYPKRLGGDRSADSEYEKKGLKLPRPAVIGDEARAREVYRLGGSGKTAITFSAASALGETALTAIEAKGRRNA